MAEIYSHECMYRCQKDKSMSIVFGPPGAFVAPVWLQLHSPGVQLGTADGDQPGPDNPSLAQPRAQPVRRPSDLKPISIYDSSGRLVEVSDRPTLDDVH